MKFRILIILFILGSCSPHYTKLDNRKPYNATGFALVFNDYDYDNGIIKNKLDNKILQISHKDLKTGTLIKQVLDFIDEDHCVKYIMSDEEINRRK